MYLFFWQGNIGFVLFKLGSSFIKTNPVMFILRIISSDYYFAIVQLESV
jgi:hypothetical protein